MQYLSACMHSSCKLIFICRKRTDWHWSFPMNFPQESLSLMEALLAGRRIDHHGIYLIAFMQWRRFRVACGGGGGGTEAAIFIWPLFWWAKAGNSSVASFLVWGGGGGKPPKCTDIKKNHIHVTYMHERAKRASASETYRPIFIFSLWYDAI